jgi:hypothetical protein
VSKEEKNKGQSKAEKSGLTGKHVALILGSVAIVSVAVVIIILLTRSKEVTQMYIPPNNVPGGAMLVTEENILDIEREVDEKVTLGMFETHMNTTWIFPDGRSPSSNAVMGNSPKNNFAFWFTVTLPDGEVLFTSGLLPVGMEIAEIKLDRSLAAGTYNAVVTINMVQDDGTPVESNMGINVEIIIQS